MPKKPRRAIIDLLQYFALRLVEMTLHTFPINANLRFCKLIGDFFFTFDKRHRERAHRHGTVRFILLFLVLLGTAVVVTIAMFQTLYYLLG